MKNGIYFSYKATNSIFLLNIFLLFLILKKIRNSEIYLTIEGKGTQLLIKRTFSPQPFEVLVNGIKDDTCTSSCYLKGDKSNITLRFNSEITTCNSMFERVENITEIDFSNFDFSKSQSFYCMFSACNKLEKVNFGNINSSSVKSMGVMFQCCKSLQSVDFSKFDTSQVTDMGFMLNSCSSLKKIDFGNTNTPMGNMFQGCSKLTSIDLSKFVTSKVNDMEGMFKSCNKLNYLDLSSFDTSNVVSITNMFDGCYSLIFLNLKNFKLNSTVNKLRTFNSISSTTIYCIEDKETKDFLSEINSNCSNDCFKDNITIDYQNKKCIGTCSKYEYNNICFNECPNGTYPLYYYQNNDFENSKQCFNNTPIGYYFDIDNYKKCFENCYTCYGEGNNTNNNCIECKTNFTFLNDLNNSNCYKNCEYFYYFDEDNNYHCSLNNQCPEEYKLIQDKNMCIKDCNNDNIYKYNFDNKCYTQCPNGTYLLINNTQSICYNNTPEGYYFDSIEEIYKECYATCKTCNKEGNEINNNCLECKQTFEFYINNNNISNCYIKCDCYYYFNEENNFYCTDKMICPEEYNKLIPNISKCINDCQKDNIYKYEYDNRCFLNCPEDTFYDENNNIYLKIIIIKTNSNTIINTNSNIDINTNNKINTDNTINIIYTEALFIPQTNKVNEEINDYIEKFRNYANNYDVSKNEEKTEENNGVIYQLTNTDIQKNNTNKNVSTLNLGDCEKELRKIYQIDESLPLIIFKIDYYTQDTLIPMVAYEIYHPENKSKLDLKYCKHILVKLNIPVSIDESKLYKYDPNSDFYNDNCFSYTTENETDIILNDSKQEFNDNNL